MARLIVEEQKEFPTLPADSIVNLLVDTVEVRTVRGDRGDWEKLEFKFKITGIQATPGTHPSNFDGLIGEFIYGSTPFKITEAKENKLRNWAEAILRRPIELGWELDTDYFLRQEVRGVTSTYEKRAKDPATNRPYVGHQIASLLPMGGNAGVVPGGAPQQQPMQQAPSGWGAPGVQQAPPQQQYQQPDPWAASHPAGAQPAANDPWAPQQAQPQYQQPQQPVQDPWAGQPAFDDEPPF